MRPLYGAYYRYVSLSVTLVCLFIKRLYEFFFQIGTHTYDENYYIPKGKFTEIIIMEVMATPHMGAILDYESKVENLS